MIKILERQLKSGFLPQAYLFYGNDEESKDKAIGALSSHLIGDSYKHSPDFFLLESNPITIEEARALKTRASQSPISGKANLFLVKNIENLSPAAAPALLKILEEPAPMSVIIATTGNIKALLPTIKSRFTVFRFWKSGLQSAADELAKKLTMALGKARAEARASPTSNNISRLEKLLDIYKLLNDPTASKRLVGEYLNLIL